MKWIYFVTITRWWILRCCSFQSFSLGFLIKFPHSTLYRIALWNKHWCDASRNGSYFWHFSMISQRETQLISLKHLATKWEKAISCKDEFHWLNCLLFIVHFLNIHTKLFHLLAMIAIVLETISLELWTLCCTEHFACSVHRKYHTPYQNVIS